jgi:hypothetical protein
MHSRPARIQRLRLGVSALPGVMGCGYGGWGVVGAGGRRCPPLGSERRARESVEARMPVVVVQLYYEVSGLEGWVVPDGQA